MSKRFKQVNIQQFAILVKELKIGLLTQEEFVYAVPNGVLVLDYVFVPCNSSFFN